MMASQVTWGELWAVVGAIVFLGGMMTGALGWLWQKHGAHDRELAEFKIKVAENYVTLAAMTRLEERFEAAMDRLGEKVERTMEKIAHIAAAGH